MESLRSTMHMIRGLPPAIRLDNEARPSYQLPISISPTGVSEHRLDPTKQDQVQRESSSVQSVRKSRHGCIVLSRWDKLFQIINGNDGNLTIDGESLDPAVVVAVAR